MKRSASPSKDRDLKRARVDDGPGALPDDMTEEERAEAERMARIAAMAEAKAEARRSANGDASSAGNGHGAGSGRIQRPNEPVSLEDLLRKKKEEAEQAPKVVFLSKEERRKLALERLEERRKLADRARAAGSEGGAAEAADAARAPSRDRGRSSRDRDGRDGGDRNRDRDGRGRDADRERGVRFDDSRGRAGRGRFDRDGRGRFDRDRDDRGRGRDFDRGRGARGRDDRGRDDRRDARRDDVRGDAAGAGRDDLLAQRLEAAGDSSRLREIEAIKSQYLGTNKPKKKLVKPSEKFARIFKMEWDAEEDTSETLNPLYANPMQPALMFGRGYRAGIDMREQRKSNNYMSELERRRQQLDDQMSATGLSVEARREMETERARLQEQIDRTQREMDEHISKSDMKVTGRHWKEMRPEEMSERDWRIFREDFDIRVRGGRVPNPMRSWGETKISDSIMRAIEKAGYTNPTPIQMQSIPIGLQQRDVIGVAETGSGKTCAFLVPLLEYIIRVPQSMRARTGEEGPLAVIMAPTRELAQQIENEAVKLGEFCGVRTVSIVGGQSIEEQGLRIRRGCDIVIGTPGRLHDCLEHSYLALNQCNYVVLDEADRMIDMGFEPQVNAVLQRMGSLLKSEAEDEAARQGEESAAGRSLYRTTVMFSATMRSDIERLAKSYLRAAITVTIGDEESSRNKRIQQDIIMIKEGQKARKLMEVLRGATPPIIIFVNLRKNCDVLSRQLEQAGFNCIVLHGGKSQDQREAALAAFRGGEYDIMIATDVAGRGLDIPNVQHVINYDMPSAIDKYTHRIGRTGRAGKEGHSTSFVTDDDADIFYDLKNYLESTAAAVPQELARHPASARKPSEVGKKPIR